MLSVYNYNELADTIASFAACNKIKRYVYKYKMHSNSPQYLLSVTFYYVMLVNYSEKTDTDLRI